MTCLSKLEGGRGGIQAGSASLCLTGGAGRGVARGPTCSPFSPELPFGAGYVLRDPREIDASSASKRGP